MQLFFHILRIKVRQNTVKCNLQSTKTTLSKLENLLVLLLKVKPKVKLSPQKIPNRTFTQITGLLHKKGHCRII